MNKWTLKYRVKCIWGALKGLRLMADQSDKYPRTMRDWGIADSVSFSIAEILQSLLPRFLQNRIGWDSFMCGRPPAMNWPLQDGEESEWL